MIEDLRKEALSDAFNIFKDASRRLESRYADLEEKVEALNRELAEKNRAMERTRRLAAMGEMAAKIAHEIRNPLGSISIFSSLLERELAGDDSARPLAERINKGVKTLDNILSNMLLFTTSPRANLKPVEMREVVEDSIQLCRSQMKEGVEVKAFFHGPTVVPGDEGLLRQLFVNLILNALDASSSGDTVTVSTRFEEGPEGRAPRMEIEVKDTGSGVPADDLDRIFDPFFSRRDRGTGLGLAIVNSVVIAHKGTIDASSAEGEGTTFMISIPGQ